jgi:threonine/homoserine/homoserine lactone efflux protein
MLYIRHGVVLLLIVASVLSLVTGFSTGAGGCVGGGPAVGGLHLAFLTAASAQEGMNATLFDALQWFGWTVLVWNPTCLQLFPLVKTFRFELKPFNWRYADF